MNTSLESQIWNEDEKDQLIELAQLLVRRLEKISADSTWAHRSSGYRGAVIRLTSFLETDKRTTDDFRDPAAEDWEKLQDFVRQGFLLLERAAREY